MPNVSVNLAVEIDASGTIEVFGQAAPTVSNKIVAAVTLPVRALYDNMGASKNGTLNSLFEFWEPSTALGERRATLSGKDSSAASQGRDYTKMTQKLAIDLQSVLMGEFDCSGAAPFSSYGSSNYTTVPHFGRLALGAYAHYLFGHVAATAAITNDADFMGKMMSTTGVSASSAGTYEYANATAVDLEDTAASTLNAKLAVRLVDAIISKDDTAILAIVEQVLGQDASRAMDADNNVLSPDLRYPLTFLDGDKIYLNIRLKRPQVTISSSSNAGAPASTEFPDDTSADVNYTLEITLEDKLGFDYTTAVEFYRYGVDQTTVAAAPTTMTTGVVLDGQNTYTVQHDLRMALNLGTQNLDYVTSSMVYVYLDSTKSIYVKIDGTEYDVGEIAFNRTLNSPDEVFAFNLVTRDAATYPTGKTPALINWFSDVANSPPVGPGLYMITIGNKYALNTYDIELPINDPAQAPVTGRLMTFQKMTQFGLIGEVVGSWDSVQATLTKSSSDPFKFEASNVTFYPTGYRGFKIRTQDGWGNTSSGWGVFAAIDIEALQNANVITPFGGAANIPFVVAPGTYNVALYLRDPARMALELTPVA